MENIKSKLNDLRENSKEQRSIMWRIENLMDKIDTIRDAGIKVLSHDNIRGSGISNPTADKAAKIVDDFTEEYEALCLRLQYLNEQTKEVKCELNDIKDKKIINQNEYDTLYLFYFEGLSLEEMSEAMHYSLDWVQELKGKAIRKWNKSISRSA